MDATPKTPKKGLLDSLGRMLHLHQLPLSTREGIVQPPPVSPSRMVPIEPVVQRPKPVAISPISQPKQSVPKPVAKISTPTPKPTPVMLSMRAKPGIIVTDYDRILEIVKRNKAIKLDEIARLLALKEEEVAQELQTLEDNGLVEVKYPAFGEPLICYKSEET